MNFERLRYLAAVARTGTVRGAATALHVTPGAVSKGLARLEEETGIQLVVQQGRGVSLTDEGQWLAQRAAHLVGEFASLDNDLNNRRARTAEICLASYDVFAAWFPGLLARQYLPGVPLSVRERWPGEVEHAVGTGISDVGVTFTPVASSDVEHIEAARVRLGVFTKKGAFTGTPTSELPFVVPSHPISGAMGQYGPLDGWPTDAPPRDVRARASALEARLELCREGEAAIVLPEFVARLHDARVRPSHALEQRSLPRGMAGLNRRVYLVRRVGSSEQLHAQTNAVFTALQAICA